jgi:hypothetical protein
MQRSLKYTLFLAMAWISGCSSDNNGGFELLEGALPNGKVDVAYEAQLQYNEGSTPVAGLHIIGELPLGIAFTDSTSFRLGGIPAQAGTYDFEVEAYCYGTNTAGESDRTAYRIVVAP